MKEEKVNVPLLSPGWHISVTHFQCAREEKRLIDARKLSICTLTDSQTD